VAVQDQRKEDAMRVEALSYVAVRAEELDEWAGFGPNLLGLQRIDKSRSSLAFRMDDRKQRIIVNADGGSGLAVIGWETSDGHALEAIASRLERAQVKVARGSRALAEERCVEDLICFDDPVGNRVELVHGAEVASDVFRPGRSMSGFRTGALGLGHIAICVDRADRIGALIPFYRDLLGFRVTDFYTSPIEACFLHANPRHHSIAFLCTGTNTVHHMMMEVFSFDDLGQGYDLAIEADRVAATLGRHTSDFITSFYASTPSGLMVEYGWGARSIDPQTWEAFERTQGPSLWGHDFVGMLDDARRASRYARIELAATGFQRPIQVMEGNYELSGVCPWWTSLSGAAKG
jgi:2,3-dihydroxybiphenyl 1,2-dioxygenase